MLPFVCGLRCAEDARDSHAAIPDALGVRSVGPDPELTVQPRRRAVRLITREEQAIRPSAGLRHVDAHDGGEKPPSGAALQGYARRGSPKSRVAGGYGRAAARHDSRSDHALFRADPFHDSRLGFYRYRLYLTASRVGVFARPSVDAGKRGFDNFRVLCADLDGFHFVSPGWCCVGTALVDVGIVQTLYTHARTIFPGLWETVAQRPRQYARERN